MDAGAAGDSTATSAVSQLTHTMWQRYQYFLDKSTPLVLYRWIFLLVIAFIYAVRMYVVQGYYIVTYGLGIYILQLLIAFLSPQIDPEIQEVIDGPGLPTRGSDEFRPFVRRLPEFKFWLKSKPTQTKTAHRPSCRELIPIDASRLRWSRNMSVLRGE
ncbi:protein RER1A-like isoform X2 [Olea europaea var. sylvestris]|uniref:protein RER1A-like isoform X2 n=1 Tax=Olea europaea var. sylvestris TaxID=158386 RepID=UPI000C1D421E|nr:protein RER1A-like isoform X2 [Olea europaea var. sylvestris]